MTQLILRILIDCAAFVVGQFIAVFFWWIWCLFKNH